MDPAIGNLWDLVEGLNESGKLTSQEYKDLEDELMKVKHWKWTRLQANMEIVNKMEEVILNCGDCGNLDWAPHIKKGSTLLRVIKEVRRIVNEYSAEQPNHSHWTGERLKTYILHRCAITTTIHRSRCDRCDNDCGPNCECDEGGEDMRHGNLEKCHSDCESSKDRCMTSYNMLADITFRELTDLMKLIDQLKFD